MSETEVTPAVRVVDLRAHRPAGVLAIDGATPRLTWRLGGDVPSAGRRGYEVQASASPTFDKLLATTGEVAATSRSACRRPAVACGVERSVTTAFAWSPTRAAATGAIR